MTSLRPIILRTGLFILLCLCWPAAVPAQPFIISGTVKTPGGQPIADANIWFTYHGSGVYNGTVGATCTSNAAGNYGNVLPYLVFMPQQYDIFVKIEKAGYDFRPLAVDAYGNPLNVPGYYIPKNSQPWGDITGKNFTGVPLQPMTSGMSSSQSSPDAGWSYFSIQVPSGATQLDVNYDGTTDNALVPKLDSWPDVVPGSGSQPKPAGFTKSLTLNASSTPPLSPGKWYIGVHSTEATSFTLTSILLSADPLPIISGKVTHFDGVTTIPLAGVSVTATNGATTALTDASGQYQVTVPYYWAGEISIDWPNARFLPVSRTYSGMTANQTEQNFRGPQYYLNVISDKGDPQGTGWYDEGTTTSWSVTNPFPGTAGVRYVTTTPSSGVVDMTGPQTITVDWKTQHFLKTSVTPPGAGSIAPTPIWYYAGSEGRVSSLPATDWSFSGFTGDLTGSATPQNLVMDQPREVIAHFTPTTPLTPVPGRILVPLEKSTIQSAINAAADGDEIIVSEGTYRECIRFPNKNIIVRSSAPTNPNVVAATIIDGTTTTLTSAVTFSGFEPASATLSGFTIKNGRGYYGAGINGNGTFAVNGTHATISYNQITGNSSSDEGGGIRDCDGWIHHNMIYGNTAQYGGGLARCDGTIEACTVFNNTASNGGGFFACDSAQINNCTVYENSGVIGGGFYFSDSTPAPLTGSVTNCTIYKNHSTLVSDWTSGSGGGIYCYGGRVTLRNCIIWGNTGKLIGSDPPYARQVYHGNVAYVFYSCIQDWESTDHGCIAADPQFVNPQQYDFQLAAGSPCIDTGTSVSLSSDFRGAPRPFDGDSQGAGGTGDGSDLDMGAYEYGTMAAPGTPVMIAEPLLTGGTSNTVSWERASGAAAYTIQCAASADFAAPLYSIYIPAATDGSTTLSATFTGLFDTTYWYRVRAENAYGGPGEWSQPTSSTQDATAPWFDDLGANPPQATAQALVSITFLASEPLAADPEVSVNDNPASLASHAGNQYTYSYVMLLTDPVGPATISISGTDGMGYYGSISDPSALSRVTRTGAGDWALYQ
jgi:hypothetical protein